MNTPKVDSTEDERSAPEVSDRVDTLTEDFVSKISWLFLILPGFVSYSCFTMIAPANEHSEVQIIAFSFCFLLIVLAFVMPIAVWVFKPNVSNSISDIRDLRTALRYRYAGVYLMLVLVAVIVGSAAGVVAERDLFYRFVKKIPLIDVPIQDSSKDPLDRILFQNNTGLNNHSSPQPDGRFYDEDRPVRKISNGAYARITLDEGEIYEGWPLYFTSSRQDTQIYMTPACLITRTGQSFETRPIFGPGVVVFEKKIRSIVFLDEYTTTCSSYWASPPGARSSIPSIAGLEGYAGETDPVEVDGLISKFEEAN